MDMFYYYTIGFIAGYYCDSICTSLGKKIKKILSKFKNKTF